MSSSSDSIDFSCEHCGTPLTVSAELAGVSGPCPTCQQSITAPSPDLQGSFEEEASLGAHDAYPTEDDANRGYSEREEDAAREVPAEVMTGDLGDLSEMAEESDWEDESAADPFYELNPQARNEPMDYEEDRWAEDSGVPSAPAPSRQPADSDFPESIDAAAALPTKGPASGLPPSLAGNRSDPPKRGNRVPRRAPKEGRKKLIAVALVAVTGAASVLAWHLQGRFLTPEVTTAPVDLGSPKPAGPLPGYPEDPGAVTSNERHILEGTAPKLTDGNERSGKEPPAWSEPSVLDPARTFIQDYLTAPSWEELVAKSLNGEALRDRMAAYYEANPYEPEKVLEIAFEHKQLLPESPYQFYLFRVVTESHEGSFPMTVEETAEGLRSDWVTYVEFKDLHLKEYLDSPEVGGESRSFHVILRRGFYFLDEVPDVDGKSAFEITVPVGGYEGGWAFLPKYSNYSKELEKTVKWGFTYFPIVELKWVTDPKSPDRPYVRLENIRQYNWRGHDPASTELTQAPDA